MNLDEATSEKQIQDYCALVLQMKGKRPQTEVTCGNGYRADIVTGDCVYELKLILDYDNLYKAKGQGEMYAKLLGCSSVVLVGYLPRSEREREKAKALAKQFEAVGIKVSFLDEDPFWTMPEVGWENIRIRFWHVVVGVTVAYTIFLSYAWSMRGMFSDPRECRMGIFRYECINPDGSKEVIIPWK